MTFKDLCKLADDFREGVVLFKIDHYKEATDMRRGPDDADNREIVWSCENIIRWIDRDIEAEINRIEEAQESIATRKGAS